MIYSLPFLIALSGVNLVIGDLNFRFDQILSTILLMILLFKQFSGRKSIYFDRPSKMIILYIFINILSSILFSPNVKYSLSQVINFSSCWLIYLVVINYIDTEKKYYTFFRLFMIAGILEIGYGVAGFFVARTGIPVYGINSDIDLLLNPGMAYGIQATMKEPNIFGNYAMMYFIFAFGLMSTRNYIFFSKRLYIILVILFALGTLLSFTRGAWLGGFIGILCFIFIAKKIFKTKIKFSKFVLITSLVFIIVQVIISEKAVNINFFQYKYAHMIDIDSGTGAYRILVYYHAYKDILKNPLLGNGTFSFGEIETPNAPRQLKAFIPSFLVMSIHDTGIIGVVVIIYLFYLLAKYSISSAYSLNKINDYRLAALSISFLGALTGMFVAFQSSSGLTLGYSWVILGMIGALYRITQNKKLKETIS